MVGSLCWSGSPVVDRGQRTVVVGPADSVVLVAPASVVSVPSPDVVVVAPASLVSVTPVVVVTPLVGRDGPPGAVVHPWLAESVVAVSVVSPVTGVLPSVAVVVVSAGRAS
jgi:hypothetical protein